MGWWVREEGERVGQLGEKMGSLPKEKEVGWIKWKRKKEKWFSFYDLIELRGNSKRDWEGFKKI